MGFWKAFRITLGNCLGVATVAILLSVLLLLTMCVAILS